jgi:hypothetical protein
MKYAPGFIGEIITQQKEDRAVEVCFDVTCFL